MAERIEASGVYQLSERRESPTNGRVAGGLDALWRWLIDVRLLLAVVVFTLAFILVAFLLPQMPDNLSGDPGESTRWLVTTASRYDPFGDLLAQFGLFNVLQSPLLKVALALIALLLLIHLAELLGAAWQLHAIPRGLHQPALPAGEPLPLPRGRRLIRHRAGVPLDGDGMAGSAAMQQLADRLATQMAERLGSVERVEIDAPPPRTVAAMMDSPASVTETRLLAVRHQVAAWLRPLLMVGLLMALAAAWLLINFGWSLSAPTLTPGKTERFAAQNVELRYDVSTEGGQAAPVLNVKIGAAEAQLNVADGVRARVNGVDVNVFPTAPGLLLRTVSGQPLLSLPGQSTPSTDLGLIFPTVGSEEVVLLERLSSGLRIVRIGETEADAPEDDASGDKLFMVETYRGTTAAPDQRDEISGRSAHEIEIEPGQSVELLPVSGVSAQVRRTPGAWLIWPALALIAVGVYGFWRKPAFALLQIAPWTAEKAVVVAQGDLRDEIDALRAVWRQ